MIKTAAKIAAVAAVLVGSATAQQVSTIGCSDGTREGFADPAEYPMIAACSAAWTIRGINRFIPMGGAPSCPGLVTRSTFAPACGRAAGNNGTNRAGTGCNVADVCAAGWEVCTSEAQVKNASSGASCSGVGPITGSKFWGTRQSSSGCGVCARGTVIGGSCNALSCANNCFQDQHLTNDVFGCGNVGGTPNCGSLTRFTHNLCSGLAGTSFNCNDPSPFDDNGACETYTFLNTNPNFGGVLCCKIGTSPDFDNDGIPDSQDNCPTVPNPTQANACNPATPQGDACEPCDANIPGAYQCGEDGSSCDHAIQSSTTNTVGIYWTDVPNTGRPCDP